MKYCLCSQSWYRLFMQCHAVDLHCCQKILRMSHIVALGDIHHPQQMHHLLYWFMNVNTMCLPCCSNEWISHRMNKLAVFLSVCARSSVSLSFYLLLSRLLHLSVFLSALIVAWLLPLPPGCLLHNEPSYNNYSLTTTSVCVCVFLCGSCVDCPLCVPAYILSACVCVCSVCVLFQLEANSRAGKLTSYHPNAHTGSGHR